MAGRGSGRGMSAQGAGDEADSADEQNKHDESVEKTGGAEINVHVGEYARENEEGTGEGKNPAGGAATVPEQEAYAEKHGNQGDAQGIGTEKAHDRPHHVALIGQEVAAETSHADPAEELA